VITKRAWINAALVSVLIGGTAAVASAYLAAYLISKKPATGPEGREEERK